ncbi:MAG: phenylacetate--CoA ligase family protein [Archaeoglobaceae archaeon]|nr:phenylacetate--CoA ligase family protein [Archaeoglobaceae archaeon]
MLILTSKKDYKNIETKLKEEINSYLAFITENSPFYRDKFKNIKPMIDTFYELPLTYDYELMDDPKSFIGLENGIIQLCSTGGTYGKRKLIFRTNEDLEKSIETAIKMFKACGISSNDKIAILQPFDLWNIGHIALRAFQKIGALSCPIGLSGTDEFILWLLNEMQCNVVYTTPSKAVHLAEISKEKKIFSKINVEKVLCAGEPILPVHRQKLKELWNADIYGIYGSEETDGIGAECKMHDGYHIFDEHLILELLDPKTLKPAESNKGVLVVTKLGYTGTILIRYLLGDLVEVVTEKCSCDISSPKIKIFGRIKETLWLYDGLKVPITSIEDAIKSVVGYLPIYQVIIEHESGKDRLTFVINSEPSKELENKFMEAIISSTQELEETFHLEKKIEVNIVLSKDMDNFVKTERGKIPKIIDRRNKK